MKKTLLLVGVLIIGGLLASGGCSRSSHKTVTLAGSTAFQPFAEKLAEHYMATHKDVRINVQGGGSAVGIQSALSGSAEIGMADLLKLPDEAASLNAVTVARDGIGIVVNPKNNVANVAKEQAHDIFTGKITNWKEIGGNDSPIRVISREEGSGTRRSFDKLVLGADKLSATALFQNSNGTVREAVASDANAIGYVSIGLINERVKGIAYEGIAPNNDNVKKGIYPLARPVFFLTKASLNQQTQDFIAYVLSKEAQDILEKEGLIAVKRN